MIAHHKFDPILLCLISITIFSWGYTSYLWIHPPTTQYVNYRTKINISEIMSSNCPELLTTITVVSGKMEIHSAIHALRLCMDDMKVKINKK